MIPRSRAKLFTLSDDAAVRITDSGIRGLFQQAGAFLWLHSTRGRADSCREKAAEQTVLPVWFS